MQLTVCITTTGYTVVLLPAAACCCCCCACSNRRTLDVPLSQSSEQGDISEHIQTIVSAAAAVAL
eukprot:2152-Heterococcus_DN1.PRE.5